MAFLDSKYLLGSETAFALYSEAASLPVIDAHNHANVAEIAANANYSDPWQVCAATDHYVWEMMRKRSIPEHYITGDAPNREKWMKLAGIFEELAGNPVYEWVHLDLRRSFGIGDALLNEKTGASLWEMGCSALGSPSKRPMELLKAQKIETMCSTDDPADLLEDHEKVNKAFGRTFLRPTWRPDKAVNIFAPGFREYIGKLGKRFGAEIGSVPELIEVLKKSHDYFEQRGCVASDHGIAYPLSGEVSREEADAVFRKAMAGEKITAQEADSYMSRLNAEVAEMDAASDWVCQLHIGARRDVRDSIFTRLGLDAGGDVSDHMIDIVRPLGRFLNRFDGRLKVVLYCLEPHHQASLATVARAFGERVRLGSAWWFNDTPVGMRRQLEYIGSVDLLWNFAGMVSDSRKIVSYASRFEMFRRILSDVIAVHVGRGQMGVREAEKLVRHMCYAGPKAFYNV